MAGIPASAKPVLLLIIAAAVGLTFTVFRDSVGVVAVVIIWAGIFLGVFGFYAFGWRKEAVSLRKQHEKAAEPVTNRKRLTDADLLEVALGLSPPMVSAPKVKPAKVPSIEESPEICPPGPHSIEPGGFVTIELDVAPGITVKGRLMETESLPFDWVLLHETQLVKFQQKRKPRIVLSGHDEPAYVVDWTVPGPGPWFLVLDAYGKKTPRNVETHLR